MAKLTPRRRWRGPPLGGRLQRGCRFCFAAHDGEVTTSRLAEWLRPEIVYSGSKPSRWRMRSHRFFGKTLLKGRTPDAAARRHSAIEGSSFSGLLTRVEIDHMRIGSAGKAASSHAGPPLCTNQANEQSPN